MQTWRSGSELPTTRQDLRRNQWRSGDVESTGMDRSRIVAGM